MECREQPFARDPFVRHRLHDPDRCWPETNCYVDLWIEVLASLGAVPEAAFGFAVAQQFGEDQFSFSKLPIEDLRRLYGLSVRELSIYRTLEQHAALHVAGGDIVLLEVDAFYLPDTEATTYRRAHTKTTIAVDRFNRAARECRYFHNAAQGILAGEDYLGALRLRPEFESQADLLPPYVEVVSRCPPAPEAAALRGVAFELLRGHLSQRRGANPFSAWRKQFGRHVGELLEAPMMFHDYAFHFPRLAGSNFELLADHAIWLSAYDLAEVAEACRRMAQNAKVLQFRLARSVARRRADLCHECFDALEADYERVIDGLGGYVS